MGLGLSLLRQLVPLELVVRPASLEIDHCLVCCLMQVEQDKAIASILTGLEVSRNLDTANRGRVQLAILLGEVSLKLILCHVSWDPLHIQVAVLFPGRVSSLGALAEIVIETEHAQLPSIEREVFELVNGSVALLARREHDTGGPEGLRRSGVRFLANPIRLFDDLDLDASKVLVNVDDEGGQ